MAAPMVDRRARQQAARERRSAVTDPDVVMAASAALLAIRSRTTHELRTRLITLGYPVELIESTIERLIILGYLDDEGYARAWVASRDRARPRGATALRREMLRKGLARDLVDAALLEREGTRDADPDGSILRGPGGGRVDEIDDAPRSSADHAAASRLLDRRRSALLRELDPRKRRQRAYALLARNGFDPGVCLDATRGFLADMDDVPPESV